MVRILIANDRPEILLGLRTVLEEHPGWEVCGEASDGIDAVSQTAERNPDIVILDLPMPELNGLKAGRTIHAAMPKLPPFLFSQHVIEAEIERQARDSGFSGGVARGSYDLLIAGIESLLRGEIFFGSCLTAPPSAGAAATGENASGTKGRVKTKS